MSGILFCRWAMIITILPLFAGCHKSSGTKSSPKIRGGTIVEPGEFPDVVIIITIANDGITRLGMGMIYRETEGRPSLGKKRPKLLTSKHIIFDQEGDVKPEIYVSRDIQNFAQIDWELLDLKDTDEFYKIKTSDILVPTMPDPVWDRTGKEIVQIGQIKEDFGIAFLDEEIFKDRGNQLVLAADFNPNVDTKDILFIGASAMTDEQVTKIQKLVIPEGEVDPVDLYLIFPFRLTDGGDSGGAYLQKMPGEGNIYRIVAVHSGATPGESYATIVSLKTFKEYKLIRLKCD